MLLHVGVRQGVDLIVIMIGVIACWCQTRGGPDCNHDRCYCMLVSRGGPDCNHEACVHTVKDHLQGG